MNTVATQPAPSISRSQRNFYPEHGYPVRMDAAKMTARRGVLKKNPKKTRAYSGAWTNLQTSSMALAGISC